MGFRFFKNISARTAAFLLVVSLLLPGCGGSSEASFAASNGSPMPVYSMTFIAHAPEGTASDDKVLLSIIDEITGLMLNPAVYEMQSIDTNLWQLSLTFPRNALVHYRYILQSGAMEAGSTDAAVDFRTVCAAGNNQVEDTIAHWTGTPYKGTTGVIRGLIRDSATGLAIPGLMVSAAGMRTLTDTSGNYMIAGVPTGKQTLTAFDLDGSYRPFVQEAVIADGQETPANLLLSPAPRVTVTFRAFLPADTPSIATVRLAGSLLSMGNTFQSGPATSLIEPARAPTLVKLSDGSHIVSLALPVSAHIRYKFTLGDGFWNAERSGEGKFVLRELIVPEYDTIVDHTVSSWHSSSAEPATFLAIVPNGTPIIDTLYIQFSPFSGIWMRPIPMWMQDTGQWAFSLMSPMEWPGPVSYRYCRNGVCGVADDIATAGETASGRQFQPGGSAQTITDPILGWVAWPDSPPAHTPPSIALKEKFRFGVQLAPTRWNPPYDSSLVDIVGLHADTVFLSPLWYLGANAPRPELRFLPELASVLRQDVAMQIGSIRAAGMRPALSPAVTALAGTTEDWWNTAPRDNTWWDSFFEAYSVFLYTYADIAQQTGTEELIILRANMLPALPGQPGTPADAEVRWRVLIRNVRLHYSGKLAVELPLTDSLAAHPEFLDEVDEIFVRVSGPLASESNSFETMRDRAGTLLDGELEALRGTGKPIFIEAAYASAGGADAGCPLDPASVCLSPDAILSGPGNALVIAPNFDAQTNAYLALLAACAERDWIAGFFSWGYYAPVALRDASVSIHGKPAESILALIFAP